MNTGRPGDAGKQFTSRYLDSPNSPQYPFGFGLSYTSFSYSNLRLSGDTLGFSGALTVKADIKNKGDRQGTEIAQLYIHQLAASITQPVKKLKDFQRVSLNPGETKTVEFVLPASKMGFYNSEGKYVMEPAKFEVGVGKDSADETLKGSFLLTPKPISSNQ
jgi:beta-glucosidase